MVKVSLKETIICQKVKKPAVKLLFLKNPLKFSFTKEIPTYLKITNLGYSRVPLKILFKTSTLLTLRRPYPLNRSPLAYDQCCQLLQI